MKRLWRRLVCWIKGHIGFEEHVGDYPTMNGLESEYRLFCERCGKVL